MRLWIAEKPSVASDIVKALGGQFKREDGFYQSEREIVSYCVGHVLETVLPEGDWNRANLPLKLYPRQLKPKEAVAKQAGLLVRLIKRPDITTIVHCGDVDDEGQLLVDEVLEYAGNTVPVKRALFPDPSPEAVQKAVRNLHDNREERFRGMSLKALARTCGDASFGLSMTQCYTLLARDQGFKGIVSVGRVQTPVLGLIVRRYMENQSHEKRLYHVLTGVFSSGADTLSAKWRANEFTPGLDDKRRLTDYAFAESMKKALANKAATVVAAAVDIGKVASAPLPYNLSRLQSAMNEKHGYTLQQTLEATQTLRDKHKAITYNRSNCSYLSDEQHADAPALIEAIKSLAEFAATETDSTRKSKAFDSRKITAHTAITPTLRVPDISQLTERERHVYQAIARMYLAQFMPPRNYDEVTIDIKCGDEEFRRVARRYTSAGYTALVATEKAGDEEEADDETTSDFDLLSRLRTGETITCSDIEIKSLETKALPLFTEATLLNALVRIADFVADERIKKLLKEKDKDSKDEHGGIGTTATRGVIVDTLKKRGFIELQKGKLVPTPAGIALITSLPANLTQPDMTAIWSEKQAAIESGKLTVENFMVGLYEEIERLIEVAEISISASENKVEKTDFDRLDTPCPACGKKLLVTPKMCACTGCAFRIWREVRGKKLTGKQIETLITKGKTGEIKGFKSKKNDTTYSLILTLANTQTGEVKADYPPAKTTKK